MKRISSVLILTLILQNCTLLSLANRNEDIAGVEIVNIEEIQNAEGESIREIRGVVPAPFDTDEEWIFAFRTIHTQKKIPGQNTVIKIFLEEDNWELGTPYGVAKYYQTKQSTIRVDGRRL